MTHDPLLDGLAGLAEDAPPGLLDRIAARWASVEGPLGELFVAFTDHGVAYLRPAGGDAAAEFRRRFRRPLLRGERPPEGVEEALHTGDAGGVAVDLRTLSDFQAAVLHAARGIPRGEVRPYAWVARRVGRPKAVRAVGTALATNPVPLLIPCHRVTRSDGSPGRYIFGEDAKRHLLDTERAG
jgi:methylated-DNA-[protein]-cysteine S-methyltransferase